MDPSPFLLPDVLVLAGGGIVGEAWMHGVLGGIEDGADVDLRDVESYVGTSAGSIVAARLAAGRRPPRPADTTPTALDHPPDAPAGGIHGAVRDAARVTWGLSAPLAGAALAIGAPVGALARAAVLSRAGDRGRPLDDLHARVERWTSTFDGRLRVCAVDRGNGRRAVFGAPGAPDATVADAVCASCAIPWVFAPVRIGDRTYVDGGTWSVTNLDAAPAGRGTHVLCLDPMASLGGADRRITLLRSAFRLAFAFERQVLRRRGARVLHVTPDAAASGAMGPDLMAPGPVAAVLAAGHRQGLALTETVRDRAQGV